RISKVELCDGLPTANTKNHSYNSLELGNFLRILDCVGISCWWRVLWNILQTLYLNRQWRRIPERSGPDDDGRESRQKGRARTPSGDKPQRGWQGMRCECGVRRRMKTTVVARRSTRARSESRAASWER
ncbi:hypothetical protein MHYP_G00276980, partial [Metynnis hypsauchen]